MKTKNDKGFECFQLKSWLLVYHVAEENKIEHLQLRSLCLDNNLFKNGSEKAFEPSGSGENSGSSYP